MADTTPNQIGLNKIAPKRMRLQMLDILRCIALIGMVVFHFSWDLAYFGYIPVEATASSWLFYLARIVASSFLFLSGFSLYLAHRDGIRWKAFIKRFILVVLAAALVSIATYIFIPNDFIYFGVLHEIALTSLVGLLFLRMPIIINLIVAVVVFYASHFLSSVNSIFLVWLVLNPAAPPSFDYVPFLPWFSAGLLGITSARLMDKFNILTLLEGGIKPELLSQILQWIGRHTLLIYLIHQPILFAGFYSYSYWFPPAPPTLAEIRANAENECRKYSELGEEQGTKFCTCAFNALESEGILDDYLHGLIDLTDSRIDTIRNTCLIGEDAPQNSNN